MKKKKSKRWSLGTVVLIHRGAFRRDPLDAVAWAAIHEDHVGIVVSEIEFIGPSLLVQDLFLNTTIIVRMPQIAAGLIE